MVEEVARILKLHPATIYRLLNAYERTGRISMLVPQKRDGGRGSTRLQPEVEKIVGETIQSFYLGKQQRGMEQTCREVARLCRNAGLEPPHDNTVRNRITVITDREKIERRRGKRAAKVQFDPVTGHFPGADWPLAVIQIDHTELDIILVDDVHRRAVGRPWITLAIDVFSRMVVGFYVSLDPPGALSTGLCIAHSILPKEMWLSRHDISTSWPCWGVPKTIHADNAREFRGNMLKRACEEYGIHLDWRPVATPHWGGHIERYLGTLLKEIHSLPGTTFSNPKERGEYDSEKESSMTLSELEAWLADFITGVYHQRVHSALKMSPLRKYEEGIFGTKDKPGTGIPARVVDEDRLRLDFMPYVERTVQRYGVAVDEIRYYHDVLRRFIDATDPDYPRLKRKFIFKRDPRDISRIHFFDPELRQYFDIPYRDISHPAISIWELRGVRRQLEKEGRENVDERLIFETYERMRQREEKAVRDTKSVRRARQRHHDHERTRKASTNSQSHYPDKSQQSPTITIKPFDEMEELD
jgi:putative transposase